MPADDNSSNIAKKGIAKERNARQSSIQTQQDGLYGENATLDANLPALDQHGLHSAEAQREVLGSKEAPLAQRQSVARHVGAVHGNSHLNHVLRSPTVDAVVPEEASLLDEAPIATQRSGLGFAPPAAPSGGGDGANNNNNNNTPAKRKPGLPWVQARLQVGPVNDIYEQEADRKADEVVNRLALPAQRSPLTPVTPMTQREPASDGDVAADGSFEADSNVETRMHNRKGGGSPLPDVLRQELEPHYGADFSSVRIHTDGESADLNKDLQAQAFTHGSDIFFGSGKYNPGSAEGKHLIAHELTHVVQQGAAASRKPNVQREEMSLEDAAAQAVAEVKPEDVDKQEVEPIAPAPPDLMDEKVGPEAASVGAGSYKPEPGKQESKDAPAAVAAIPEVKGGAAAGASGPTQAVQSTQQQSTAAGSGATQGQEAASGASAGPQQAQAAVGGGSTPSQTEVVGSKGQEAAAGSGETKGQEAAPGAGAGPSQQAQAAAGGGSAPPQTEVVGSTKGQEAAAGAGVGPSQQAQAAAGGGATPPQTEVVGSTKGQEAASGAGAGPSQQAQAAAGGGATPPQTEVVGSTKGQEAASGAGAGPSQQAQAAAGAGSAPPQAEVVGSKGQEAAAGSGATKGQETAAGSRQAAASAGPEGNPAFQGVVSGVAAAAAAEQQHKPGAQAASESAAAAQMPAEERTGKAQDSQAAGLDAAASAQEAAASGGQAPGFDKAAFVAAVKARIDELTPQDPKQMENIEGSGVFSGAKEVVDEKVKSGKEAAQGNVDDKLEEEPNTSAVPEKTVTPLPKNEPGQVAGPVDVAGAVPTTKQPEQVEQPIATESQAIDTKMAEANVTEEQLEKSNEPSFQAALDSKNQAQTEVKKDLQDYRATEKDTITSATKDAQQMEDSSRNAMHGERSQSFSAMDGLQSSAKTEDEAKRAEIGKQIDAIFTATETDVTAILESLDTNVDQVFNTGAEAAKSKAVEYINRVTKEYKDERYAGVDGFFTGVGDFFTGMPPEYYEFFVQGRDLYVQEMEVVLNQVADIVGEHLTRARLRIAEGRQKIADYVAQQPQALREVAQKAATDAMAKFDALEENVNAKQEELVNKLAQNYTDALGSMDAELQKMKDEAKGMLSKAFDAVTGVINQIIELGKGLAQVLGRAAGVIGEILKNPVEFIGNLFSAIGQGFNNFASNIGTHLQNGLISWLTGTLGEAGIKLPEKLDLPGILDLVMQILGLTYDQIRAKVAKAIGPQGETVVSALEKTWEVFQIIRTQGLAGLWDFVKDMIGDLQAMVIDQIKTMVMEQVVQAGVKWLIGLLGGPAGAFIKAVMAIIDVVKWFINNAGRIITLVNSILDSVEAIASGNIGGAAKFIEDSLAKALPLVISFLADLLGLGGISKKVQGIIEKVQAPINKAINWIVQKAVAIGKGILSKLKSGKGQDDKDSNEIDERTMDEKQAAVDDAISDVEGLMANDDLSEDDLKKALPGIKSKYKLVNIELVKESDEDSQETVHVLAEINPKKISKPKTFFTKMPEYIAGFTHKSYDKDEYQRQLGFAQKTIWGMKIDKWLANREAFVDRSSQTGSGRDPKSAEYQRQFRDQQEASWKTKRIAEIKKLNPTMKMSEIVADVDDEWTKQAALHPLDQVAGGEAMPTEMGNSRINSSIGSTWKGHVQKIEAIVNKIAPGDQKKWNMNVTITLDGSPV